MAKSASTLTKTKTLQEDVVINYVPVSRLRLDRENPRFAGLISKTANEEDVLGKLRSEMHLDELIESIKQNGYYSVEPLLTVESGAGNELTVVEGNRRLAAIKILLKEKGVKSDIRDQLTNRVPVAVYPNRKTLWTYLGFRHINGPKEWDSYSKAAYALRIHNDFKVPISEIVDRIGDKNATVVRMCLGLRVLEQAEQKKFFSGVSDLKRFYFSHLYTILSKKNTREYLGLKDKRPDLPPKNPVPPSKLKNLKILIGLLFGSADGQTRPVVQSQNPDLKLLDAVLANEKALRFLRENSQENNVLEVAYSYVHQDEVAVTELVYKALNFLRKASSLFHKAKADEKLLSDMEEIKTLTQDLIDRAERKSPKKNRK